MYPSTLIVLGSVAAMVISWVAVMLWAHRSGQIGEDQELRRRPLDDDMPIPTQRNGETQHNGQQR
jgi:nitrogen fixation-related uncharacterized protein